MDVRLQAKKLNGLVKVPSSKSAAHRAVIAGALSKGESVIKGVTMCDDIVATIDAVKSLGAKVNLSGNTVAVTGIDIPATKTTIDCKESGSTIRFMIPLAAAFGTNATFIGSGRLPMRPLDDIITALTECGVTFNRLGKYYLPLEIKGKTAQKQVNIAGNVSSQYLTGLLFASAISGGSVALTTSLESSAYIDMTCQMIEKFGGKVDINDGVYSLSGNLSAREVEVEGDWSAASFFFEAAALGSEIEIIGLDPSSKQADKVCIDIFGKMGVGISFKDGKYHLVPPKKLVATDMDASQCPDLVPAVAVAMGFAEGRSVIYNARRLRIKESDRLKAVADGLEALGIKTKLEDDKITIFGGVGHGGTVDSVNDHRIAMAFACACNAVNDEITIKDAHSVSKSYPDFYDVFSGLGGKVDVINNR
ncbi:MAG: 3-phosphoshikimate 1-carboxyvinyltransferase [Clostridia bacterium]|nr:3-phosphoshikimate 1-carboxyvinyltransferase [Clostridia bacterium]